MVRLLTEVTGRAVMVRVLLSLIPESRAARNTAERWLNTLAWQARRTGGASPYTASSTRSVCL